MTAIDVFRLRILRHMASLPSFANSWVTWQTHLDSICPPLNPTPIQIFQIGEHLSNIFRANVVVGRGQGAVSSGGTAWECLIEWYLNLIFWGTPVLVARRNNSFIPQFVRNSLAVTISNHSTNAESDIIAYSIPNVGAAVNLSLVQINQLISATPTQANLGVVQCKTNWNDNAQIPMLWDLIYNATGNNRVPNVSVGIHGASPLAFRHFSYAFSTVPTTSTNYTANSLAVLRVRNMTGGNYWGKQTFPGVASAMSEYFGRNFAAYFAQAGGVPAHIAAQQAVDPLFYERFRTITF